jgi:dTDP-4-dehydrorhamnose 3,5-epimerase-like enzyme
MIVNEIITIKKIGTEETGVLSFFEVGSHIPFEIKRIYYTYKVPNSLKRGMHAHKDTMQAIWCPFGSIKVVLDDGNIKTEYMLDSEEKVLLVGPGMWRDLYWNTENAVLCVAASTLYDEEDYIRDYDEFIKFTNRGNNHEN